MPTVPPSVLAGYERFSLYNSPYPAHDRGAAVDCYPPGTGHDPGPAPAPVAGTVVEVRTVRCPDRPYAVDRDHLVVVELADPGAWDAPPGTVARILHVDPRVAVGDAVAVGDSLGRTVRSGFFGEWVDNHLHVGLRPPDANHVRASGSLELALDTPVTPVAWDGTGTVVETGPAGVRLDAPTHPDPADDGGDGGSFAAVASDEGVPLDGGLAHYATGGALDGASGSRDLSLLGTPVGTARGRHATWHDVTVVANGVRVRGLSLFASRVRYGAKLVAPGHEFAVGDAVRVAIRP